MPRALNQWLSRLYTKLPWWLAMYARVAEPRAARAVQLPWTDPAIPLDRAMVALVTTAGVHRTDDRPFDMYNAAGDASFRIIPSDTALDHLTITHDYYDHAAADRDLNVVFPLERLGELVRAGLVGRLAPNCIGAMGHIRGAEERRLLAETAPAIARRLRADRVDYALISPG